MVLGTERWVPGDGGTEVFGGDDVLRSLVMAVRVADSV